jgi:N-acetylmannosamine-6-phosphate 2-epimerase / N-acetylmannosamine kinase
MTAHPVLAIDIGGTKTSMALVADATILDLRSIKTRRSESADVWIAAIQESVTPWSGRYAAAGLALTGGIRDGRWHALNPATLPIPSGFPIVDRMSKALGVRVTALNDGQAAVWGEYRHGAGAGSDLVYLTVSTGIGGGIVLDGKLRTGRGGSYRRLLRRNDDR